MDGKMPWHGYLAKSEECRLSTLMYVFVKLKVLNYTAH